MADHKPTPTPKVRRKREMTCGHPWLGHAAHGLCRPCYVKDYMRRRGITGMTSPENQRKWYDKSNAERTRAFNLKRRWGMSVAEADALIAKQGGLCLVCGCVMTLTKGPRRAQIDHDHKTGLFRGVLCRHCNTGIGLLGDDPEVLMKAAAYLEAGIK